MSIPQRSVGDVTVLDLTPQLTTDITKDLFRLKIDSLLANDLRRIVLNLSALNWINSYGIGLLVAAYRAVSDQGGRIVLAGANDRVKDLLRVVGLDKRWDIYEEESAAVESFAGQAEPGA